MNRSFYIVDGKLVFVVTGRFVLFADNGDGGAKPPPDAASAERFRQG
ncbi:MAG: hypothetical protein FWB83_03220 [Treponema sp.]|nr:hypothetical protein [Treponema sp.]